MKGGEGVFSAQIGKRNAQDGIARLRGFRILDYGYRVCRAPVRSESVRGCVCAAVSTRQRFCASLCFSAFGFVLAGSENPVGLQSRASWRPFFCAGAWGCAGIASGREFDYNRPREKRARHAVPLLISELCDGYLQ